MRFRDFSFLLLLQKWWVEAPFIQGSQMFQLCKKLQWLKLNIKEWNTSSFQNIFQAKSQIENKIKDLNVLIIQNGIDQNTYKLQKELNAHLQEILAREELFWKQKSRETWLQEGDRNTKYFHASVKMRRAHNQIHQIKNGDGDIIVDAYKIQQEAVSFLSTLFTNGVPNGIEIRKKLDSILQHIPQLINEKDNMFLFKPFSLDEIRHTIFSMYPDKSPRPDGFPALFFKKC